MPSGSKLLAKRLLRALLIVAALFLTLAGLGFISFPTLILTHHPTLISVLTSAMFKFVLDLGYLVTFGAVAFFLLRSARGGLNRFALSALLALAVALILICFLAMYDSPRTSQWKSAGDLLRFPFSALVAYSIVLLAVRSRNNQLEVKPEE
ncbi:MAG TPA: hypothetical protein VEU51_03935 [Candidatus Acidoferrales bacterium]|nr:hypothetical protein [Candidatus Acidoferrales bacterium]